MRSLRLRRTASSVPGRSSSATASAAPPRWGRPPRGVTKRTTRERLRGVRCHSPTPISRCSTPKPSRHRSTSAPLWPTNLRCPRGGGELAARDGQTGGCRGAGHDGRRQTRHSRETSTHARAKRTFPRPRSAAGICRYASGSPRRRRPRQLNRRGRQGQQRALGLLQFARPAQCAFLLSRSTPSLGSCTTVMPVSRPKSVPAAGPERAPLYRRYLSARSQRGHGHASVRSRPSPRRRRWSHGATRTCGKSL